MLGHVAWGDAYACAALDSGGGQRADATGSASSRRRASRRSALREMLRARASISCCWATSSRAACHADQWPEISAHSDSAQIWAWTKVRAPAYEAIEVEPRLNGAT